MKTRKHHKLAAAAAALLLTLTLCVTAFGEAPDWGGMAEAIPAAQRAQAGLEADAPLLTEALLPAGSSISDWTALAMARTGLDDDYAGYLARLRDYVEGQYRENGGLHRTKATEYHRIALTVAALGGDPTAFGTAPDGAAIDLLRDGVFCWQGDTALGGQGLNGLIFALLAIDAVGAESPADALYTRQSLLEQLVAAQLPDGGFSLSGGGSMDVDITAMALQALAPYQADYADVIDGAISALSAAQLPGGGFASWDVENMESSAQVILALCALDIDPAAEERFRKEGGSVVDALLDYRLPDGSFAHELGAASDAMACEQAMQALCAMARQQQGEAHFFDLRDVEPRAVPDSGFSAALVAIPAGAAVLAAALVLILRKKREKH